MHFRNTIMFLTFPTEYVNDWQDFSTFIHII